MTRHLSRLSRIARWRNLRWAVAAPLLPFALWACTAHPLEAPNPLPEQQNDQYYEVNPVRDIDILFMVDDSPSMANKQKNLSNNFPSFMDQLKKIPGGLPNVHVGVVSSDLGAGPTGILGGCERPGGDRGIMQVKAGCGLDPASVFITSQNAGTMNNFTGDISAVFSCMALLGDQGCGYEHQLQSTRVALYENITPQNKGFLRPDAYLGIILLTDEDDCSADPKSDLFTDNMTFQGTDSSFRCAQVGHVCSGKQPPIAEFTDDLDNCKPADGGRLIKVTEVVDSIRALKARPDQQIIVSAITGWPPDGKTLGAQYKYQKTMDGLNYAPICSTPIGGDATPALRIKQFVDSFGANGGIYNICSDDFSPAMTTIGMKLAAVLGTPCITAPLVDTDGDGKNGIQADCQVIDRVPKSGGFDDTPLPACGKGGTPCWQLAKDATCTASNYKISVDRGGKNPAPGLQQAIKCLSCPPPLPGKPEDPRCYCSTHPQDTNKCK